MIQIGKSARSPAVTSEDLATFRESFALRSHVRLAAFLDGPTLALVRAELRGASFHELVHKDIGPNLELCMNPNRALGLLMFLMNNDSLFRVVETIAGSPPITRFSGRVYRLVPGSGHLDDWHDDVVFHRLVGLTINLSEHSYAGGVLEIRGRGSSRTVERVPNVGPGDAILFRLGRDIEHRVSPMEGTLAKTAFAGWFHSGPGFMEVLREVGGASAGEKTARNETPKAMD
jgi:hypothetical protein